MVKAISEYKAGMLTEISGCHLTIDSNVSDIHAPLDRQFIARVTSLASPIKYYRLLLATRYKHPRTQGFTSTRKFTISEPKRFLPLSLSLPPVAGFRRVGAKSAASRVFYSRQ